MHLMTSILEDWMVRNHIFEVLEKQSIGMNGLIAYDTVLVQSSPWLDCLIQVQTKGLALP